MTVESEFKWLMDIPVPCPGCHKEFARSLGSIEVQKKLACPDCGTAIDVSTEEWRSFIEEATEACAKLQVMYRKIG